MATKRKYSSITVEKKIEILQTLKSGKSQAFIAKRYSVTPSSVRIISEREGDIKKYFEASTAVASSTKHLIKAQKTDLCSVLYQWCVLCREKNIETSATLVYKKALELSEKLQTDPPFNASHEWVANFMQRYSINAADVKIFRTRNRTAADIFRINFERYLKGMRCTLDNVYNVSYTGLMWKAVPEYTSIFHNEKSMVCPKMYKDHVTVLLCANITGCHKLPVLVIAKCADSQDSNNMNINSLSIMYDKNSTTFIDNNIFNKWFVECFLQSVIKKQKKKVRREKVLLVVDNARWDCDLGESKKKDEFVTVVSFPYHATPHIQPMDCGIIECFKIMYRRELLEALLPLPYCNTKDNVIRNHKDLILWDCCRMIQNAWSNVGNTILKISWSKLLVNESSERFAYKLIIERNIQQIEALLGQLSGFHPFKRSDLENWFKIDQIEEILMKVCTDEVLQNYQNNILKQKNTGIVDEEDEIFHYWY